MRVMLKVKMPVERANELARTGELGPTLRSILEDLEPEAAYFADEDGQRCAYVYLNVDNSSEVPKLAEPWFLALQASVELHPCMSAEDLAAAAPHLRKAVEDYG